MANGWPKLAEQGIGLELFQYRVAECLIKYLNDELDNQQAKWNVRDTEWNQLTGQEPSSVVLEHLESENIYRGHRPSLIEAPPQDKFPNISVMAYQGRPVGQLERIDQASNYSITIDIETAVKGISEAETDARKHRMVEAIHQVLASNAGRSLQGMSQGWSDDPIIAITDIYKRKADGSYGDDWFWQMARLRYLVTRHNQLPEDINIDQI